MKELQEIKQLIYSIIAELAECNDIDFAKIQQLKLKGILQGVNSIEKIHKIINEENQLNLFSELDKNDQ